MPADVPFAELVEVNPRRGLRRGETYPFVEMAAIPEGGGRPTHLSKREFDGGGSKFAVGDTLFARITPCTENGKIAYVESLPNGAVGFGSTELIVLSARPGAADPRFVYQVAASERTRSRAVGRMLGTSGRQRVPTWFFTEELTVPAFSVLEQRAIAAVLDAIDDAIERTEAVIAATEELRRALLHDLLTRGVPGWHSDWKQVSDLGTVPACWDVTTLGDLCSFVTSGSRGWSPYFRPTGALFIRSQNIIDGQVDYADAIFVDPPVDGEARRTRIRAGDLLISITGEPGKVTVADTTLPEAFVSQHVALARPSDIGLSDFLGAFLAGPAGRGQFSFRSYGQTRPGLNLTDVQEVLVALPEPQERAAIVAMSSASVARLARLRAELGSIRSVKSSLADALLTGRARTIAAVL